MSKENKTVLKEARELLKQKEYKEAIKKCKKVLKEDKCNYVALVLLGAAMQDVDEVKSQAPLALKRAIEIQPNNPLAWQGLALFYEKEPDNAATWLELVPAYCKLLQLDSDSSKFSYFLNNISDLTPKLKDDAVLSQVIATLRQLQEASSEDKMKLINASLAVILTEYPDISSEYTNLLEDVLASASKNVDVKKRQDYYKKYLKILYKSDKLVILMTEAAQMHEQFPQDTCPLEWICRVYFEQSILNGSYVEVQIEQFYKMLLTLNAQSNYGLMAKAVHLHQIGNLIESRNILNRVVASRPQWLHSLVLLGEVNVKLHCWEEAENAAAQALCLMKNDTHNKLQNRIDFVLIEALTRSMDRQKWELAIQKCKELLSVNSSNKLLLLLTRAYVFLEDPQAPVLLDQLKNEPSTRAEVKILQAIDLKNRNKLEEAIDILGSVLENSEAWLMLGKIHWDMSNYNDGMMAFLKGVHMDPYNWEYFIYLGHYYMEYGNDLERSRKCYQKALQINPSSEQAGIGLSTAYRLLKNSEANMQLLQRVTSQSIGSKWAWLQLGLQYLDREEATQAIDALRIVIRTDPTDNHCWECLADAYWARGAYTSALKSYQRALELSPESLYPMIQLANIKLMLGQLTEAKNDFDHVLRLQDCYIPALKGLAETCLGLAKEHASRQLLGRARDNIQEAVNNLTDAVRGRSDLSCIWKLFGDACYRVAILPEKYCFLNIVPGLIKSDCEREFITINKSEIFLLSSRCYCRALSLSEDSALLWHDLACCYLSQLQLDFTINCKDVASKSLAAAKQAVRLSSSSWFHWNLLGNVCMSKEIKNYALAQHCYIMAIERESNNAVAWANLGSLYLYLGSPYKANEAFSRAQRADPAYANSWIGQALIAEKMNKKEAMDLFRHATQLGYHSQAAIGYAHWVLTTLLDPEAKKDPLYKYTIENMHAIPVASDVINWYIERTPNDLCALNMHGLLLERQKLYRPAVQEFSKALQLVTKVTEKDAVRVNLARVLVQLERYEEAVELCRTVKNASFNSHCQLALSLFKAEQYEESYSAYEAALHWLAGAGSDKAHVLCAMAAMAYMFQEIDDVKTLLFQCIQIQPPVVAGLLAAAALGLLHDDMNLTTLVLKELEPYRDHPDYRHHVAILSAYSYLIQNDLNGATKVLSKVAHRHPADVGPWVSLVRLLLKIDVKAFGNCAQKALFLGRNSSLLSVAQVACISTLSMLIAGHGDDRIRSVQKTVYSFPTFVESWANLIIALLPRCNKKDSTPSAHWLTVLISIIRKELKATRPMTQWLSNNERKASLIADQLAAVS